MKYSFMENGIEFVRISHGLNLNLPEDVLTMAKMVSDITPRQRPFRWIIQDEQAYFYQDRWWPNQKPEPKTVKYGDPIYCPRGHVKDKVTSQGSKYCSICKKESYSKKEAQKSETVYSPLP